MHYDNSFIVPVRIHELNYKRTLRIDLVMMASTLGLNTFFVIVLPER